MPRLVLGAALSCVAVLLTAALTGCGGGTQLSTENRELIVTLATAVSTRETKWLDEVAAEIETRREGERCSDAEYFALKTIIDQARNGDWDGAQKAAYDLRDSQEPNAKDLKNLAERKHSHEGKTLTPKRGPRRS